MKSIFSALIFVVLMFFCTADFMFDDKMEKPMGDKEIVLSKLNSTTGGPYTYSQSKHHFYGTAYDGSYIDTTGCCCGQSGSCRNNPSCQCQVSVGPLPQGTYTLGNMYTFKGMPYCYDLYPAASNNMCGRSGFLIHGGGCSGNPSEGCIVIESESTRYMIKSGATLKVVA
eukprot:gene22246-30488_t